METKSSKSEMSLVTFFEELEQRVNELDALESRFNNCRSKINDESGIHKLTGSGPGAISAAPVTHTENMKYLLNLIDMKISRIRESAEYLEYFLR